MNTSEYLVVIMLMVFVLYGLGNLIGAPIIARRFYREKGLADGGKSQLSSPADSVLLAPLATSRLYQGQYANHAIEQCQAYPKTRRKFTLSKVTRKHNQSRWCITRTSSEKPLPPFCLLPISEAATVFLMLNDPGVDLSDDTDIENRYYLRTEHPQQIKGLITDEIRGYLLARELISIECVNNSVVIKRAWPVEKIKSRLTDDIVCSVDIVKFLLSEN